MHAARTTWSGATRALASISTVAGSVRTDAVGVARFEVPLHAAFSLTTVPVT